MTARPLRLPSAENPRWRCSISPPDARLVAEEVQPPEAPQKPMGRPATSAGCSVRPLAVVAARRRVEQAALLAALPRRLVRRQLAARQAAHSAPPAERPRARLTPRAVRSGIPGEWVSALVQTGEHAWVSHFAAPPPMESAVDPALLKAAIRLRPAATQRLMRRTPTQYVMQQPLGSRHRVVSRSHRSNFAQR